MGDRTEEQKWENLDDKLVTFHCYSWFALFEGLEERLMCSSEVYAFRGKMQKDGTLFLFYVFFSFWLKTKQNQKTRRVGIGAQYRQ